MPGNPQPFQNGADSKVLRVVEHRRFELLTFSLRKSSKATSKLLEFAAKPSFSSAFFFMADDDIAG
jgi:acetolactate synthase regulatory subunit